ncbi:MAG: pseudouridine synthase [Bacteroidia bacterium]
MAKEFKRTTANANKYTKKVGVKKSDKKRGDKKESRIEKAFDKEDVAEKKTKRTFSKNTGIKPSFERYRDDSKPSDFGSNKRSSSSFERKTSGRVAFKKNESETDTSKFKKEKNTGEHFSFAKKDSSKPPLRKSTFKKAEVNPYDLDERDLKYQDDDKKTSFNKSKTTKYTKKPYEKKTFTGKRKNDSKPQREVDDGLIRLNKYIANAGICSRREADTLIETGVVQVNGKTITEMGYRVKPTDIIKYGGQVLKKERMVYLVLNKPKDYITTIDDPQKRRTVLELVQGACRERIYPVGRLDRATTGLLLFTNDGDLTKKLTHPKYGVRKIYHAELDKPLKNTDLNKITEGLELEDGLIKVDEVSYVGNGADKTQIGIEIHSGKNRIVRRIFEHLGYNVRKLDRVMFGSLTKKDLSRGRWRLLSDAEVGMLKMISSE